MRRMKTLAAFSAVSLLVATTAFAGGAACSGDSDHASAKSCPVSGAKMASGEVGGHCDGMSKSADAMAKACTIGKNQMIYSFSVPGAECDGCVHSIQSALMREAGVHCAHVDLGTHVAYVITDKKLSTAKISSVIKEAGFSNKFRGEGKKMQAEFAKAMAGAPDNGMTCCAKGKDKV